MRSVQKCAVMKSEYRIVSRPDRDRVFQVEIISSGRSKITKKIQIGYDDARNEDQYMRDWCVAYDAGLTVQAADEQISESFDEADLERNIEELFSIWGDPACLNPHGLISSFLLGLRPGKGIDEVFLSLWQKKMVCFIHIIFDALKDVPGFDSLKRNIRKGNIGGGHDAHLLAAYVYHSMIGLKDIESDSEKPFDTDFRFQKNDCEYLVQVKDLRINPQKKFYEQSLLGVLIWQALDRLGIRSSQHALSIGGIVPRSKSDPNFDWYEFLRSADLSQPIAIPNEDGVTPPLRILLTPGDQGSLGRGIDSLKYLSKVIRGVAKRVTSHDPLKKKYVCLVFVGRDVVGKIADSSESVFELWRDTDLDGVIYMEFRGSMTDGHGFDVLEQYKTKSASSLSRIQYTAPY